MLIRGSGLTRETNSKNSSGFREWPERFASKQTLNAFVSRNGKPPRLPKTTNSQLYCGSPTGWNPPALCQTIVKT
jgi:hypothetical protein